MCIGGTAGKVLNPIGALPQGLQTAVDPVTTIRQKLVSAVAGDNQKEAFILDPMKDAVTDPLKQKKNTMPNIPQF